MTTQSVIAQQRLQSIIDAGQAKVMAGLEALQREYQIRRDLMAKPLTVDVVPTAPVAKDPNASRIPDGFALRVNAAGMPERFLLTEHSRSQFLARAAIPQTFADKLFDLDLFDLFRDNIQRLLPRVSGDGLLLREVAGTVKGVLSPAYRRMDTSPIVETFVESTLKAGLLPHQGMVTDTRAFVSFVWPDIVEVAPGEYVIFGVELRSSDYGRGALEITLTIIRLLCLNGMIGTDVLRKVHLGRRFDFGDAASQVIEVSNRTHRLDTATVRSAVGDVVKALPAHRAALQGVIAQTAKADEKEFSLASALGSLKRAGVRAAVTEQVKQMYETQMPVEALPQQPGAWRFANVVSLLSQSVKGDAQKDLEDVALPSVGVRAA
jgi:hypothetical protein